MYIGVVLGDGAPDLFEEHRFSGLRRRHDEPPLTLADGRDQIDDTERKGFVTAAGKPDGFGRVLADQRVVGLDSKQAPQ